MFFVVANYQHFEVLEELDMFLGNFLCFSREFLHDFKD